MTSLILIRNISTALSPLSLIRRTSGVPLRQHTSKNSYCNNVAKHEIKTSDAENTSIKQLGGLTDHKVNGLEKWLLVWAGSYKKFAEVPNLINQSVLERAQNKARVKISLIMMAMTVVGCAIMMVSGRRAAGRGESVVKMNEEFHRKHNEATSK